MDLKQQLVIWKRTGFLLDNVALSDTLLDNLLNDDVITPNMAAEIQVGQDTSAKQFHSFAVRVV